MPLSRLPLPSFSLILTAANGDPLLMMQDFNPAPTSVQVNLQLPQLSAFVTAPTLLQPGDHDPLMQTLDTRFQGQLAYQVRYAPLRYVPHTAGLGLGLRPPALPDLYINTTQNGSFKVFGVGEVDVKVDVAGDVGLQEAARFTSGVGIELES
ncbi:hypothetical protein EST38_g13641 [Candolleomyces aberdarensis]|uniref:Uncharacterized protein n=1 Tax=Candolleomyces aberdarensis TaxID=2316362 RepID=A0A4Q2CZF3_9AGAR|nr:hypothetical protein EST38_g13641 [Candolleomyces aberdarensis]